MGQNSMQIRGVSGSILDAIQQPEFLVEVAGLRELSEIPGVWDEADFVAILDALEYGDRLSSGQIQNVALEMLDEKLGEEYGDF